MILLQMWLTAPTRSFSFKGGVPPTAATLHPRAPRFYVFCNGVDFILHCSFNERTCAAGTRVAFKNMYSSAGFYFTPDTLVKTKRAQNFNIGTLHRIDFIDVVTPKEITAITAKPNIKNIQMSTNTIGQVS